MTNAETLHRSDLPLKKLLVMGFFTKLFTSRNLIKHDGRPLWKYFLSDPEYIELKQTIISGRFYSLDPKDVTLFFSEWWKREYAGGKPSKEEIYNFVFPKAISSENYKGFFELAKQGAIQLGIKWIKRQNVLYFRTLLLQGGIPVNHISSNMGAYDAFLNKLLETNCKSVEDIVLYPELTNLLPTSCQNNEIYENCLSIVESFRSGDGLYQEIFNRNTEFANLRDRLSIKSQQTQNSSKRIKKPAIYWALQDTGGKFNISLKLGFADINSPRDIQYILNLPSEAEEASYPLYLNDIPVCTFRKVQSGNYRTQWASSGSIDWDYRDIVPQLYYLTDLTIREDITHLISYVPFLNEPSLWAPLSDGEWRFIKGNQALLQKAVVMFPTQWVGDIEIIEAKTLIINNSELNFISFSGDAIFSNGNIQKKFSTSIPIFDWVIKTQKPTWIARSNIQTTINFFRVVVFDEGGNSVSSNQYKIFYKRSGGSHWTLYYKAHQLPVGALDIKIEYNSMEAFDSIYNVGNIQFKLHNTSLHHAEISWENLGDFRIILKEDERFSLSLRNSRCLLDLNLQNGRVPKYVTCRLKRETERSLYFEIDSPFRGVGLVTHDGTLIPQDSVISWNELKGISILTTDIENTTIKLSNELRKDVIIFKEVSSFIQPLIFLKDSFQRLFFLADSMNHMNCVRVQLIVKNTRYNFYIKGFTHRIDSLEFESEGKFQLNQPSDLSIFAHPLSSQPTENAIISLEKTSDGFFQLPTDLDVGQFIVFSGLENGKQLQPRFLNTDATFEGIEKEARIRKYAATLLENDLQSSPWSTLYELYSICINYELPFSTFDQLRAIGIHSKLASKAFIFLSLMQEDIDEFIQIYVPMLEQDLGFCFHWINRTDWVNSLDEYIHWNGHDVFSIIIEVIQKYFVHSDFNDLFLYLSGRAISKPILLPNEYIIQERSKLGVKVITELPKLCPHITQNYGINIAHHESIKLVFHSAIAVAESIMGNQKMTIWSPKVDILRRNIQYVQFISPDLYKQVILKLLSTIS